MTIHDDPWRGAPWREATFRKAKRSQGANGCVELARPWLRFGVRDSKNAGGPVLDFTEAQGVALLDAVKRDRLG